MRFQNILGLFLLLGLMAAPYGAPLVIAAEHLPNAPEKICPLPIGSKIPQVTLQTLKAEPFDLTAHLKTKPSILIYFRGGW